ncbi:MAG: hypothetical protein JO108_33870 [Acidobacteriaceae bacterium]|nr:hypothetical protein [Acidobacteriaceae bacterium]
MPQTPQPIGDNFLALRSAPNGLGVRIVKLGPDTLLEMLPSNNPNWNYVRVRGPNLIGW